MDILHIYIYIGCFCVSAASFFFPHGRVEFPGKVDDKDLKDLLSKILEKDAEKRPSPADLQKHQWLENNVKRGFTKPSNEEKLK